MLKTTKSFGLVLLCIFLFTSCEKDTLETNESVTNKSVNLSDSIDYTSIELDILNLVNTHRQTKGLSNLSKIDNITFEAENHSAYMVELKKVNHDNFARRYQVLVEDIGAKSVGENVAFGYRTAEAVVKAWINSEGHRVNIEGDFTHFGISVMEDNEGNQYFTNIFVKR